MCRWHAVTAHQRSGQQDSQIGLFETPMPTLILTLGCLTTLADPRGTSPSTVAILAHYHKIYLVLPLLLLLLLLRPWKTNVERNYREVEPALRGVLSLWSNVVCCPLDHE